MELLGWIGKPVVVLLNQLGAPRAAGARGGRGGALARAAWRRFAHVRAVLPLDAFARCWVQELTLLAPSRRRCRTPSGARDGAPARGLARAAPRDLRRRDAVARRRAWRASRPTTRDAARRAAACATRLRQAGAAIGIGSAEPAPAAQAQQRARRAARRRGAREHAALIAPARPRRQRRGRDPRAARDASFELRLRLDETQAAIWGGAVTGALVGLKADLLSGGLTLGGGLIAGGLLGALGGAGLARCVNLVRGTDRSFVAWNARGARRAWSRRRCCATSRSRTSAAAAATGRRARRRRTGQDVVAAALAPLREALAAAWADRPLGGDDAGAGAAVAALADAARAGRPRRRAGGAADALSRRASVWPSKRAEDATAMTPAHALTAARVRALVFDVFGTVVDWRGSIVRDGAALSAAKGVAVDWPAFADAWRAGYQPAMQRVRRQRRGRRGSTIDALHRGILDTLLPRFGLDALDDGRARARSTSSGTASIPGPTPSPA